MLISNFDLNLLLIYKIKRRMKINELDGAYNLQTGINDCTAMKIDSMSSYFLYLELLFGFNR